MKCGDVVVYGCKYMGNAEYYRVTTITSKSYVLKPILWGYVNGQGIIWTNELDPDPRAKSRRISHDGDGNVILGKFKYIKLVEERE